MNIGLYKTPNKVLSCLVLSTTSILQKKNHRGLLVLK